MGESQNHSFLHAPEGKKWLSVLAITGAVMLCYIHTLNYPPHLDDYPNIFNNAKIHLPDLSIGSILQSFHAHPSESKMYRPIAMLSFGLNWFLGGKNPTLYRFGNIFIHVFASLFIYAIVCSLSTSPALKDRQASFASIAFFSALLWAVNPVQIQSVTYIVQRMAGLAALFSLLSIYCYIRFRQEKALADRVVFFVVMLVSVICGVLSKENAAIVPLLIVLVEIIFFQQGFFSNRQILSFSLIVGVLLILLWVLFKYVHGGDLSQIPASFSSRPFTLTERLMSQPRALILYLSLIFWPVADRFSIEHDFAISKSLLAPWTTLPSLLLVVGLFLSAVYLRRKQPLYSFAILFYLTAHLVESSILPLEMIFEHRNYLPSAFLFLPVVAWIVEFGHKKQRVPIPRLAGFIFLCCFAFLSASSTYLRNLDWHSHESLWRDAYEKTPGRARPAYWLGQIQYDNRNFIAAEKYYLQSLNGMAENVHFSKAITLNALGAVYARQGRYTQAIAYFYKALELDPSLTDCRYNLIRTLAETGSTDEAFAQLDIVLEKPQRNIDFYMLKGLLSLHNKDTDNALSTFRLALQIAPDNPFVNAALGKTLSEAGFAERGMWFFKRGLQQNEDGLQLWFFTLECAIRVGDNHFEKELSERIFQRFSLDNIEKELKRRRMLWDIPLNVDLVQKTLVKHMLVEIDEKTG